METVLAAMSSIQPPWSDKLRSILIDDLISPDLWKLSSTVTAFGIVGDTTSHIEMESLTLTPFCGLQACNPRKNVSLVFNQIEPLSFPVGTTIGITDAVVTSVEPAVLTLEQSSKLWFIPAFQPNFEWHSCNLFCGAFEGWTRAIDWCNNKKIASTRSSISIDCDQEVMRIWSLQNQAEYRVSSIPCDDNPTGLVLGFGLPVHEFSWANWCRFPVNVFFTVSPPCQSWSAAGTAAGLECDNGFAFIQSLQSIKIIRPIFAAYECSDAVAQHEHFKIITMFMRVAGYELIWSNISKYDSLAPMRRSRWLAVWIRLDVQAQAISVGSFPRNVHRFSWDHPRYRFVIPEPLFHQLILSRHLKEIYGNYDLLPHAKRAKLGSQKSLNEVLKARVLSPDEIMPTLCAMYSQQHVLCGLHLSKKGIFAPLLIHDGDFTFIDPIRFLALLGLPVGSFIAVPSKISVAFHQIGNAISVPQALNCLLVAFKAILRLHLDIHATLLQCWNERIEAGSLIFIAFREAFLFTTPQDLSLRIDFDFGAIADEDCIECVVVGCNKHIFVKQDWTIEKFALTCGFLEISRQGFQCLIDGKVGAWDTLILQIVGCSFSISVNESPLVLVHVPLPPTQEWTQVHDDEILACVIHAENNFQKNEDQHEVIPTSTISPDFCEIQHSDHESSFPQDGPFDRCLIFAVGSSEREVALLYKNASDSVITNCLENMYSQHDLKVANWTECFVHPFSNADRVFLVDLGNNHLHDGILVLLTSNRAFLSCEIIPSRCVPVNISKTYSIVCKRFLHNDSAVGRFSLCSFANADWIELERDTSLPDVDSIQGAIDIRLNHFDTTWESVATDEFDFICELIRAECPDCCISSIVDARCDLRNCDLDSIRRATRSIASGFEEGKNKILTPVLISGHWCALEAFLRIDGSIKFVAVGFPQDLVHQVLHFAKICLFAVSNVVHTFTMPFCGFDGMCGWMILKRWFKILDLSIPIEFDLLDLEPKLIKLLDKFLPVNLAAHCKVTHELVQFARSLRRAFIVDLVYCDPAKAFRHPMPPWGRAADDDAMNSPKSKPDQSGGQEDPWKYFDPWKTGSRSCKWEDLKLPSDHPFVDATGKSIPQVHRHRLNSNVSGIAFVTVPV